MCENESHIIIIIIIIIRENNTSNSYDTANLRCMYNHETKILNYKINKHTTIEDLKLCIL